MVSSRHYNPATFRLSDYRVGKNIRVVVYGCCENIEDADLKKWEMFESK